MAKRFVLRGRNIPESHWTYGVTLALAADGDCVRIKDEAGDQIEFSPEQFEQFISLVKLEDVPEPKSPGQRLYEEAYENHGYSWQGLSPGSRDVWERRAQRLGIQPL